MSDLQNPKSIDVVKYFEEQFLESIKLKSRSIKRKFAIEDALSYSAYHSERDKLFILVYDFFKKYPPEKNDFIKYVKTYFETGIMLDEKYFKSDKEKLHKYYKKVDEKKEHGIAYNPFNSKAYRNYVMYMVLKLKGHYEPSDDLLFNVSIKDSREFNPATKIPSVLRGNLPISITEYDIKKAFPTFLDIELKANYRYKIYDVLDKILFAKLINANSEEENEYYYNETIQELKKVYGDDAYIVLSKERFLEKGRLYRDLTKYEKKFIERFLKENHVIHYVRLHDAILVLQSQIINVTTFDIVEFGRKEIRNIEENQDAKELFYYRDDKDKLMTTPVRISKYLVEAGIIRVSTSKDEIQLIHNKNNIVEFFNYKTNLLTLLREGIIESNDEFIEVENLIAHELNNSISKALPLIPGQKLIFYRDTQYTFGLPFQNGFFLMEKNGNIKPQQYDSVKGFFIRHEIQNHVFTETNEIGDYEKFIDNIAGENSEILKIIIGYLAHDYKDPSNSPAIILSDEGADGTKRNGGRGKTLIYRGLKQLLTTMLKGGKEFNPDYDFVFGDLDDGTRLYCIDDVIAGFKYDSLYTNILGGINRQRKGSKAEMLEFEKSPKFLITTNWLVPYSIDENSTNRRFIEFKVNNYYNNNLTPVMEFGKRFFLDWDITEWNKFYSFIFRCVKLYFDKGLVKPVYDKDIDNYNVKFGNEVILNEFERILKIILQRKQPFNATDFLKIYEHYENEMRNNRLFNHKNIRDYIEVWFTYHIKKNNDLKNWKYSKSSKKWLCENFHQNANLSNIDILKHYN